MPRRGARSVSNGARAGRGYILAGHGQMTAPVMEDLAEIALFDDLPAGGAAAEVPGLVRRFAVFPSDVIEGAGLGHGAAGLPHDADPIGPAYVRQGARAAGQ